MYTWRCQWCLYYITFSTYWIILKCCTTDNLCIFFSSPVFGVIIYKFLVYRCVCAYFCIVICSSVVAIVIAYWMLPFLPFDRLLSANAHPYIGYVHSPNTKRYPYNIRYGKWRHDKMSTITKRKRQNNREKTERRKWKSFTIRKTEI